VSNRSKEPRLFDHLVGYGEQRRRNLKAKGLGGVQIDEQRDLGDVLDRQVCGLPALQNSRGMNSGLSVRFRSAASVAQQPDPRTRGVISGVPKRPRLREGAPRQRQAAAWQRAPTVFPGEQRGDARRRMIVVMRRRERGRRTRADALNPGRRGCNQRQERTMMTTHKHGAAEHLGPTVTDTSIDHRDLSISHVIQQAQADTKSGCVGLIGTSSRSRHTPHPIVLLVHD
jgi:hypothetical protein